MRSDKKIENSIPLWLSVFLSLWNWTEVIFFSFVFFSLGFITLPISALFDRGTRRITHGIAAFWGKTLMATSPFWSLEVRGQENVLPGKTYVIIANHQSLLDILVVLSGLPWHIHFKFLAKRELFPIPFIGWHMILAKYIPINRSSHESGKRSILAARQWLRSGVSVLFFPEGTRSRDGNIHAFKSGAFKIAQDEKVEVLPVVIEGTGEALPKKSWKLAKNTRFILSIGKPVGLRPKISPDEAKEAIRNEMIERLERIKASSL